MADLRVEGTQVTVRLAPAEALAARRREVHLPLPCLRMVHVEEAPMSDLRLLRLVGVFWPGAFAVGTCHRDGRRELIAVRARQPAVVLDAEGSGWDRVLVSHPDAVEIAADLAALILGRGPGAPGRRGMFPASHD